MPQQPLENARALFIRRWGEMAASWGISRTMAEIHALLFLAQEPLCMDEVMDQIAVSRGSASMNLRELVNWGLIIRLHHRGDRKEYFEAEKDVWQMFEIIVRERRRREVQPIVETTERCLELVKNARKGLKGVSVKVADQHIKRYKDILDFCDIMNTFFVLMDKGGKMGLKPLAKVLGKLTA